MVPHRAHAALPVAEALFNRRLSGGRAVVENAFGLLKQTFRELHQKSDLHVAFFPDVVMCCAILHNILLKQSHDDIESLLLVLGEEEATSTDPADSSVSEVLEDGESIEDHEEVPEESGQKRRDLGVFLSLQQGFDFP